MFCSNRHTPQWSSPTFPSLFIQQHLQPAFTPHSLSPSLPHCCIYCDAQLLFLCSPMLSIFTCNGVSTDATPQSPVMAKISTKRNVRKPLETNPQLCFPLSRSVPAGAVSSQRGCRHGGESRRAGQLRV